MGADNSIAFDRVPGNVFATTMAEENKPISNSAGAPNPLRRRRRGSRGGRGRSRRPAPNPTPSNEAAPPEDVEIKPDEGADFDQGSETQEAVETEAAAQAESQNESESPVDTVADAEANLESAEREPQRPRPSVQRPQDVRPQRESRPQRPPQPPPEPRRQGSAVAQAVEDIYGIVETLKKVMEELDELLETLELAERQKIEDERELENLRRAMRQLQPRPSQVQARLPQREPSRHQPHHHDRAPRPAPVQPARNEEVREQSPEDPGEPPQT